MRSQSLADAHVRNSRCALLSLTFWQRLLSDEAATNQIAIYQRQVDEAQRELDDATQSGNAWRQSQAETQLGWKKVTRGMHPRSTLTRYRNGCRSTSADSSWRGWRSTSGAAWARWRCRRSFRTCTWLILPVRRSVFSPLCSHLSSLPIGGRAAAPGPLSVPHREGEHPPRNSPPRLRARHQGLLPSPLPYPVLT